jgi:hypothetical protein
MSIGSCFYCLVDDDVLVPAVTAFQGTLLCVDHARERAVVHVAELPVIPDLPDVLGSP